jgi:RNA polymerase sigma-70 factor (sigma-E family)
MDIDILDSGPARLGGLVAPGGDPPGRAARETRAAREASTGHETGATHLAAVSRNQAVALIYTEHSLGLVRLAHIMLGDRTAAEDVVQEAFLGLYRRWSGLSDPAKALQYARSAVLNGCRSVLRYRARHGQPGAWPAAAAADGASPAAAAGAAGTAAGAPSAEAAVLDSEEHRALLAALHRLPDRQREAVVLRYYLDMSHAEIAATMGISPGSVRSATSRALESLGHLLEESR